MQSNYSVISTASANFRSIATKMETIQSNIIKIKKTDLHPKARQVYLCVRVYESQASP